MKRLIISVLLLIFSIGFCIFSQSYLKNKTDEFDSLLSQCSEYIKAEDLEKAEEKIESAKAFWQNNKGKFKILIDGSFCESAENCLDTLSFSFKEGEYTEAKNSLNECRNTLRQIIENERFSLQIIL